MKVYKIQSTELVKTSLNEWVRLELEDGSVLVLQKRSRLLNWFCDCILKGAKDTSELVGLTFYEADIRDYRRDYFWEGAGV